MANQIIIFRTVWLSRDILPPIIFRALSDFSDSCGNTADETKISQTNSDTLIFQSFFHKLISRQNYITNHSHSLIALSLPPPLSFSRLFKLLATIPSKKKCHKLFKTHSNSVTSEFFSYLDVITNDNNVSHAWLLHVIRAYFNEWKLQI